MGRGLSVIARVECRSEGAAEQLPVAVSLGGTRIAVAQVLDDAILGSAVAGGANRRHLVVRLTDGQALTLEREEPLGEWRVYRCGLQIIPVPSAQVTVGWGSVGQSRCP